MCCNLTWTRPTNETSLASRKLRLMPPLRAQVQPRSQDKARHGKDETCRQMGTLIYQLGLAPGRKACNASDYTCHYRQPWVHRRPRRRLLIRFTRRHSWVLPSRPYSGVCPANLGLLLGAVSPKAAAKGVSWARVLRRPSLSRALVSFVGDWFSEAPSSEPCPSNPPVPALRGDPRDNGGCVFFFPWAVLSVAGLGAGGCCWSRPARCAWLR